MTKESAELEQLIQEPLAPLEATRTLERIMTDARRVTGCDAVGIFRRLSPDAVRIAASEPAVRRADELQLEFQEGPCVDAATSGEVRVIVDTRIDLRWSRWGQRAAELGWLSVLSAPVVTPQRVLGALNLYSRTADGFDERDAQVAVALAEHTATVWAWAADSAGLRRAMDSRHLIGQAQGILMERYGVAVAGAFSVLRRYSQDNNVKLRAVAERIVSTREIPDTWPRAAADDPAAIMGSMRG